VNSFAMVQEDLKLIETHRQAGWKWEAYDLRKDPQEQHDLVIEDPRRVQKEPFPMMRATLERYRQEAENAQAGHVNPELSEDEKRMLRDLGYVAP